MHNLMITYLKCNNVRATGHGHSQSLYSSCILYSIVKTRIMALQISKLPLVLNTKPVIRAIGRVEFSCDGLSYVYRDTCKYLQRKQNDVGFWCYTHIERLFYCFSCNNLNNIMNNQSHIDLNLEVNFAYVHQARICSWNQPVLSNESKNSSSRKKHCKP